MKDRNLKKLNLLEMHEDLMAHIVNIGYVLEGDMERGDPAKKLLVSLEHSISDALGKIEEIRFMERKNG